MVDNEGNIDAALVINKRKQKLTAVRSPEDVNNSDDSNESDHEDTIGLFSL